MSEADYAWDSAPRIPNDPPLTETETLDAPAEDCDGCGICQATIAGATVLSTFAGAEFEDLDAHTQSHYRAVAAQVMTAMSSALVQSGAVQPVEGPPE